MNPVLMVAANVAGVAVFIGGIAVCVWFDQRGKTRRRELEHAERMLAIEHGRPLDDAAVARSKALGAIGVAVPVVSLSAGAMGSFVALAFKDPWFQFAAFAVNWVICGAVALVVVPTVLMRFRERPSADRPPDVDDE